MREVQTEAKKPHSIQGVFRRQVDLGLDINMESSVPLSLNSVERGYFFEDDQYSIHDRETATGRS